MADDQSGLDTWSYLADIDDGRDSTERLMPLVLSIAGALGVAPFAVIRFMNGEWIVGVIDTIIVAGFIALGLLVHRTRQVRVASIAIALLSVGGVLTTVYVSGAQQVFWAYPALMAVFFLLKPGEGIICALVMIVALIPAMLPEANAFRTTTVMITISVMSAFAYAFSSITNSQRRLLLRMATKDALTGTGNRRALDHRLAEIVAAFERRPEPSSILLLDLDHFKAVNDRFGHATGDEVLRRVADIVRLRIRVTDSMYRIGGEEFVVLLEGETLSRAARLAEQLRTLVQANELAGDAAVTVSIGVAELEIDESAPDWLNRADEAMYRAKRLGRNRTVTAGDNSLLRPRLTSI